MSKYPVGPGWWPLLDEMEQTIRRLDPEVQLMYKEKYGTVQVDYITESPEHFNEINRLTMEVEKASETICEFCGRPGRRREQQHWLLTACDRCADLNPLERRKVAEATEAQYERSAPSRLEKRLTDFYGKPIEEIGRIEGDEEFWDED